MRRDVDHFSTRKYLRHVYVISVRLLYRNVDRPRAIRKALDSLAVSSPTYEDCYFLVALYAATTIARGNL